MLLSERSPSNDISCNTLGSAQGVACCNPVAFCLDSHYCLENGVVSRGSCTDKTWTSSACPQYCQNGESHPNSYTSNRSKSVFCRLFKLRPCPALTKKLSILHSLHRVGWSWPQSPIKPQGRRLVSSVAIWAIIQHHKLATSAPKALSILV